MSHEQPATQDTSPQDAAVQARQETLADELVEEQEDWFEEPTEPELPRRPRRRLLGTGGSPVPLALLGVLLIACGFIGGVLVEKGQGSSGSSGALASRVAALRSGAGGGTGFGRGAAGGSAAGGSSAGGSSAGGSSAGGSGAGAFAGGAGGAGATVGQVAYVSGDTLYVTNAEGNTVKVTTSVASTVTKTVKADVKGIHPGETAIVTGSPGANGAISAESIRVSEAGGGGLGALFGGRGGGSSGGGRARGGGGEPALFGG
jgi:hypothetical protein